MAPFRRKGPWPMECLQRGPPPTLQADAFCSVHTSPDAPVLVQIQGLLETLDPDRAEAETDFLGLSLYDGMAREEHLRIILAGYLGMQVLHSPPFKR